MITAQRAAELQATTHKSAPSRHDLDAISEGLRIMYKTSDQSARCVAQFNILSGPELKNMQFLEESDVIRLLQLCWNFDSLHNRFMISL